VSLQRAQFVNNAYWTDDSPIRIGETVYPSISAWAESTQQEMLNGALAGVEADPLFTPDNDFRLLNASPLVDAGLPSDSSAWPSWWAGLGSADFYGTTVPQGPTVDIGAVEYWDLAGDFNLDGVVDAADYVFWRKFVQEFSQYATWRTNYGRSIHAMGSGSGNTSVPEPQSMALLAVLVSLFKYSHRCKVAVRDRTCRHPCPRGNRHRTRAVPSPQDTDRNPMRLRRRDTSRSCPSQPPA
jgi:hypothetical protein